MSGFPPNKGSADDFDNSLSSLKPLDRISEEPSFVKDDEYSQLQRNVSNETIVRPSSDDSFRMELGEGSRLLEHRNISKIPLEVNNLLQSRPTYSEVYGDITHTKESLKKPYRPIFEVKVKQKEPLLEKLVDPDKEIRRRNVVARSRKNILMARTEAVQTKVENYAEKFEEETTGDAVMLAEMEVEALKKENEERELLLAQAREQELLASTRLKQETIQLREESQAELVHRREIMLHQIKRSEAESIELSKLRLASTKSGFRTAGRTLSSYLDQSKSKVRTRYQDLSVAYKSERHNLSGNPSNGTKPENWADERQIVEVHIELARCVKDKLPKGRYAMLCSVLDRVGGTVFDYQTHKWRRITAPKTHNGEYYLNNLRFEKSLLIVTPSRDEIKPSMVYLFELFLLKSKDYIHDQVLGWGVFPLIDSNFELNQGKFKVPLLFGPVDPTMDKYCEIEKTYRKDIDNWLCNLYFSVTRKDALANSHCVQLVLDEDTQQRYDQSVQQQEIAAKKDDFSYSQLQNLDTTNITSANPTTIPPGTAEPNSPSSPATQHAEKKRELVEAILDTSPGEDDSSEEDGLVTVQSNGPRLEKAHDFDSYTFTIPHIELSSGVLLGHKLRYITDEALVDLGFQSVRSAEFWMSLVILMLTIWIRAYMHSLGSWILLKLARIPVNSMSPMIYGFKLDYSTRNVGVQLGVILMGNIFNTLLFGLLILLSWLLQHNFQKAPRLVYKFVASYGMAVVTDFFLLFIVDICRQNWKGEAFALYVHYNKYEGNGFTGVIIIVLLYMGVLAVNSFIFYNYLVFLHMEGRLIDIYTRVTAKSGYFFIPFDNEVSSRYLRWVIAKAKAENRTIEGQSSTVHKHAAITYHNVTDPAAGYGRSLVHVSIYRKREDGRLVLYRHFVKTGDGAICELEEGDPFTVDEHPLLETWPRIRRRFLGSEEPSSSFGMGEEEEKKLHSFIMHPCDSGVRESLDRNEGKEDEQELVMAEPQIVLIKGE